MGTDNFLPAIVTRVGPNDTLNLTVFRADSGVMVRTSVSRGFSIGHWSPREDPWSADTPTRSATAVLDQHDVRNTYELGN